jgi:hypothetical protein
LALVRRFQVPAVPASALAEFDREIEADRAKGDLTLLGRERAAGAL